MPESCKRRQGVQLGWCRRNCTKILGEPKDPGKLDAC